MSATYELFTRWKAQKGIDSDNAGALALGTTRASASLWKQGRNAEADIIEKMAKDLGEDPAMWAALVMKEQSKGEASRAWARIARRLGAAAAIAVAALLPLGNVKAATADSLTDAPSRHYAKLWTGLTRLGQFVRWALSRLMDRAHGPSPLLA